jgi:hypothetical protein
LHGLCTADSAARTFFVKRTEWCIASTELIDLGIVQMIKYVSRLKEQANSLYHCHKVDYAIKKYDRAVSNLKRFHGEYTDKQGSEMTALQAALLSNLAAAYMAKEVCALWISQHVNLTLLVRIPNLSARMKM